MLALTGSYFDFLNMRFLTSARLFFPYQLLCFIFAPAIQKDLEILEIELTLDDPLCFLCNSVWFSGSVNFVLYVIRVRFPCFSRLKCHR